MSEARLHIPEDGPPPLSPGECIAPGYAVIELLRRGDALDVYDVWSAERDCRCVAKALRPDRRADRTARARLLREGRLLLRFTHPHLVRAYALLERPAPVLILETLTGETLGHWIGRSRRRISVHDVTYLGIHLCSALTYLHRHDVLHLDLKPSNIMVECGTAKLLDLSIARPPSRGRRGIGTPHYLAPEQARGAALGAATDVWGLGTVLFEAITGRRASASPDDCAACPDQAAYRTKPVHTYRRVPPDLARIVDQCLAPAAAARPTVREITDTLRALTRK